MHEKSKAFVGTRGLLPDRGSGLTGGFCILLLLFPLLLITIAIITITVSTVSLLLL